MEKFDRLLSLVIYPKARWINLRQGNGLMAGGDKLGLYMPPTTLYSANRLIEGSAILNTDFNRPSRIQEGLLKHGGTHGLPHGAVLSQNS